MNPITKMSNTTNIRTQYTSGLAGESEAERYLASLGYTPITRRYRGGDGEIDLILRDGDTLVFVEVKARPRGAAGQGLLAVTPAKQRRMTHAARRFLLERDALDSPVRFDVVEITASGLLHVKDAFRPQRAW